MRESDIDRMLLDEREQVRQRDLKLDHLMIELNASRKSNEDLKLAIAEMEKLRGELAQKFDDLRFDSQNVED